MRHERTSDLVTYRIEVDCVVDAPPMISSRGHQRADSLPEDAVVLLRGIERVVPEETRQVASVNAKVHREGPGACIVRHARLDVDDVHDWSQ